MGSRAARSTATAFGAAVLMFLLVALMLTRPAGAAQGNAGQAGKPSAAAEHGKSDEAKADKADAQAEPAAKPEQAKPEQAKPEQAKADEAKADHGKPEAAPTTSPQPKSNADMNPGGANNGGDCGAYCSTRDGSPSGNGNGGGEAKGKPCAGCVGKADNKNPPGQAPDGTDHNAGYECDRNHGIGRTNPAHTGCKPTTPPPCVPTASEPCTPPCVPTAEEPCTPPCVPTAEEPCTPPCVPTTEEPCDTPTPTPSVLPTTDTKTPPTEVKGVKLVRPRAVPPQVIGTSLPRTGSPVPVGLLLALGFGMVGLGISVTISSPKSR